MAKPEWGTKRTCLNCGVRFYDLGKKPITCPSCETSFEPEAFVKTRRSRQSAPSEPKKPVEVKAPPPQAKANEPDADDPTAAGTEKAVPDDDDDDTVPPVAGDAEGESDDVAELVDKPGKSKEEG